MDEQIEHLANLAGEVPSYLVVVGILLVGVVLSVLISWAVAALIRKAGVDSKISAAVKSSGSQANFRPSTIAGRAVFWLGIMLTTLALFGRMGLDGAAGPLGSFASTILNYIPRVLGAIAILAVAWLVGTVLRSLLTTVLVKSGFDARMSEHLSEVEGREDAKPLSQTLGDTLYWLTLLLFLPAALGALQLRGLLEPVSNMFEKLLGFVPNVVSAVVIFLVGTFVAKLLQRVLSNLTASAGINSLSERVGVQTALGKKKLSDLVGLIGYILVLIPMVVASLNALNIESITAPASNMLGTLLDALPAIFGAALVLGISYFIGRLVADLVTNLLSGAGFDNIWSKLGLSDAAAKGDRRPPSALAGQLVMVTVMLFAFIEASGMLGFTSLAALAAELMELGGHILLGLVIFALGLYIANAVAKSIRGSQVQQSKLLSNVARVAILVLAGAMGLRQMGIANEIITNAFTLTIGAFAVAFAVAFGLGGREWAAQQLREWTNKFKS